MSGIGQAFKDAGVKVAILPAKVLGTGADVINSALDTTKDVVGATGKIGVSALNTTNDLVVGTGKISKTTLNTTNDLVDATGKIGVTALNTTNDVTGKTGEALSAAAGTVAATVKSVENLSGRLENYTKEKQKQAQFENETATFEKQNATDIERAEIEANREIEIQKIKKDLEVAQKKIAAEQERLLASLTADQTQAYLNTQDNISKQNKARYYGFTNNNPSSNDIGSTAEWFGYGKWCYSYIPQKFIKEDNPYDVIDIIFPEILLEGPRPHYISAINKKTGEPITITFESVTKNNFFGKRYMTEVCVVKYKDEQNNDVEKEGTIEYHKILFLCRNTGGKRRRSIRRTSKRRRTNKKRRSIRRTNKTNKKTTTKRY